MSLNQQLSELFHSLTQIMEIKGVGVFKVIAFQKVGRILNDMTFDIRQAYDDGKLDEVPGIGESSRKIIQEFIATGRSTDYDEAAASVPAGLLPLLDIPGLGPKTIALFWKEKGITSLEELVKALDDGSLVGLKGIGEKKLSAIKQGIALRATGKGRLTIGEALPIAEALAERLRAMPRVKRAEVAGSVRRRRETIGDVDLICCLTDKAAEGDSDAVAAAFVAFPEVQTILGQGTTKASVVTVSGLQVDLRIVPPANFGAALLYFTGSKEHNVKLRGRAQDVGLTLNEWGLYKISEYDKLTKKTGEAPAAKPVASKTEADVYAALKLPYVEPEMREDRGEIEAAEKDELPSLITLEHVHGDLHSHTTASDGQNSIEEMAEAAKALGYKFLAITDHSKSQVQARGLTVERLLQHVRDIHAVGDRIKGIKLLAGCEVDILSDGRLDFEDAILKELDIVVASPHVALTQDEKKATDRMLRAIESRYVNIIGHPTGRLINRRAGLPLRFEKLFEAAAKNGTAMEINAGDERLDLSDLNARAAVAAGVMLAIDTDAHSIGGLGGMPFGVGVARRAWVKPVNVINCLTYERLKAFLDRKR